MSDLRRSFTGSIAFATSALTIVERFSSRAVTEAFKDSTIPRMPEMSETRELYCSNVAKVALAQSLAELISPSV